VTKPLVAIILTVLSTMFYEFEEIIYGDGVTIIVPLSRVRSKSAEKRCSGFISVFVATVQAPLLTYLHGVRTCSRRADVTCSSECFGGNRRCLTSAIRKHKRSCAPFRLALGAFQRSPI